MKYFNSLKNLVVAAFVGMAGIANAQTSHPLAFGIDGVSSAVTSNFYKDYVGLRFQVSSPLSIAGDKTFTAANDGSGGTTEWGGAPMDFIDQPVAMGPTGNITGCSAFPLGHFTGKIAIIWRGDCEFGFKALKAQEAGAVACVIVNNVSGGPVGMAAGASGGSVTIPVYMISLDDGNAIQAALATGGVNMTIILNWGVGNGNDLGFVPGGAANAANYAMPYTQLAAHPDAYKGINGAYIANFGLNNATNVKLRSELSFTPTGGSASNVYSDSVALASFPAIDSIYTFFGPEYNIPATGTGKYDLKYTVTSDSTDAFVGDNSYTHTFYTTDTLWSKGRYDFAANKPISTFYTRPSASEPFIWGVPFFVANGGSVIKSAEFSVSNGPGPLPGGAQMFFYVFKWVDAGTPVDSLMEVEELQLVGAGIKSFDGTNDSSFEAFSVGIGDTVNGDPNGFQVFLDANSWYFMAPEVPVDWALGMDGVVNGYPRTYGRSHFHNKFEMYNPIWFGDRSTSTTNMVNNPSMALNPIAFPGIGDISVDSVVFSSQKTLLPSIAFRTSTKISNVASNTKPFADINMYPNPATDYINVSVKLDETASQLTYSVIDAHGKLVSREYHNNVKEEVYSYNTTKLPSGNYYIIVSAGSKLTAKKFTVIK